MTLGELLPVFKDADVRLYSGKDGRLVAKTKWVSLKRYADVRVLSVFPRIEAHGYYSNAHLYVFGDWNDIQMVKGAKQVDA